MYPGIPVEMSNAAAQLVLYLFGAVAVMWTFLVGLRGWSGPDPAQTAAPRRGATIHSGAQHIMSMETFVQALAQNWHIWLVSVVLVVAAVIDGWQLKVPNWITFPMIISGWAYSGLLYGWAGFGWSLAGTAVGLGLLLPAYAIGGMGAGDVKLLAGVGAWVWGMTTLYAFCVSAVIGGLIAVAMVFIRRGWRRHSHMFMGIVTEVLVLRNPDALAAIAADRKSSMLLLPYGIPIAIGTIAYFAWTGMLL